MDSTIYYTIKHPEDFQQLFALYEALGWNSLKLTVNDLEQMCRQSWYAVYAFDDKELVGMGRVISDGVITGIICGLCVRQSHQSKGIGKEIMSRIVKHCEKNRVIPQLMCHENLESYYENFGFERFTIGMKKKIDR